MRGFIERFEEFKSSLTAYGMDENICTQMECCFLIGAYETMIEVGKVSQANEDVNAEMNFFLSYVLREMEETQAEIKERVDKLKVGLH